MNMTVRQRVRAAITSLGGEGPIDEIARLSNTTPIEASRHLLKEKAVIVRPGHGGGIDRKPSVWRLV